MIVEHRAGPASKTLPPASVALGGKIPQGVNAPTIGAEAHLPFGGVKQTGNGHREGGWEVYDFYSETKTIYVDFSGHLQRAQIDTEFSP